MYIYIYICICIYTYTCICTYTCTRLVGSLFEGVLRRGRARGLRVRRARRGCRGLRGRRPSVTCNVVVWYGFGMVWYGIVQYSIA